jgi:hypothetical protein
MKRVAFPRARLDALSFTLVMGFRGLPPPGRRVLRRRATLASEREYRPDLVS